MLCQRLRRWTSIKPAMVRRLVFLLGSHVCQRAPFDARPISACGHVWLQRRTRKAKRRYLLTWNVSRYRLSALHGRGLRALSRQTPVSSAAPRLPSSGRSADFPRPCPAQSSVNPATGSLRGGHCLRHGHGREIRGEGRGPKTWLKNHTVLHLPRGRPAKQKDRPVSIVRESNENSDFSAPAGLHSSLATSNPTSTNRRERFYNLC